MSDWASLTKGIKETNKHIKGGPGSGRHKEGGTGAKSPSDPKAYAQATEFAKAADQNAQEHRDEMTRSLASQEVYKTTRLALESGGSNLHYQAEQAHERAAAMYESAKQSGLHYSGTVTNPGASLGYHQAYAQYHSDARKNG